MNTQLINSLVQTVLLLSDEERQLFEQRIIDIKKTFSQIHSIDWIQQPFFGIWRDRQDMQNSIQWVRDLRKKEWGAKYN